MRNHHRNAVRPGTRPLPQWARNFLIPQWCFHPPPQINNDRFAANVCVVLIQASHTHTQHKHKKLELP